LIRLRGSPRQHLRVSGNRGFESHSPHVRTKRKEGNVAGTRITVQSSIEFRDAVMRLAKTGDKVYARRKGSDVTHRYRIISGLSKEITWDHLLVEGEPPVQMEDFAQAMWRAAEQGQEIEPVDVFTVMEIHPKP
jgi:hypothetical protein